MTDISHTLNGEEREASVAPTPLERATGMTADELAELQEIADNEGWEVDQ